MSTTGRGPSMQKKVESLRALIEEVRLVSSSTLAKRWDVSSEAVRQMLAAADAPAPVFMDGRQRFWALPEVEHYRSVRLQRAAGRGGRRS